MLEYVAGKAAALIAFLLFVTWVPALLLLVVQILLAGSFAFVQKNLFLFPAITVFACLQVLMATFTMLALSSLSKSSRFVAAMYAGVILFSSAIQAMFWAMTRSSAASLISPTASLNQLGDVIFRVPPRYETPAALSLLVVAAARGRLHPGARAARPRRGGGGVTLAAAPAGAPIIAGAAALEVVRPGHRPERRHGVGAAGHHRAARPERRRASPRS